MWTFFDDFLILTPFMDHFHYVYDPKYEYALWKLVFILYFVL